MITQNIKVAVDAVVFGYNNHVLQVLLVKPKEGIYTDRWVLVGGFVKDDESLQNALQRELEEESGLKLTYFEQLYTFGDQIHRDPRFRVISVSYFALVNSSDILLKADTDVIDAQWFSVNDLPALGYDHQDIIQKGLERLQNKVKYQPLGFDLLPEKFLFSDLERLYESLLNKEIDRRNFRKKILSFGLVDETNEFLTQKAGRPAKLYTFNRLKYSELTDVGFVFEVF